jgi:hypothetical protein
LDQLRFYRRQLHLPELPSCDATLSAAPPDRTSNAGTP